MTNFLLFVLVISLWLIPQIYFLYCLEKRRPWATEVVRSMTLHERVVYGHDERLGQRHRHAKPTEPKIVMPPWQRGDVWTNWL